MWFNDRNKIPLNYTSVASVPDTEALSLVFAYRSNNTSDYRFASLNK